MNWIGHSEICMISESFVISLRLSMIFPSLISSPLALAIFIGISCYKTKQTMLGRDMYKENICNEMLLRSRMITNIFVATMSLKAKLFITPNQKSGERF